MPITTVETVARDKVVAYDHKEQRHEFTSGEMRVAKVGRKKMEVMVKHFEMQGKRVIAHLALPPSSGMTHTTVSLSDLLSMRKR